MKILSRIYSHNLNMKVLNWITLNCNITVSYSTPVYGINDYDT